MTACTDDERRRVAEAFRRYGKETTNREFASLFDVFDACGLSYYDGAVLYDRLADLIEPGTTSDTTTDTTKSAEDTTKAPTSSDTAPTSSHPNCGTVEVGTSQVPECDREALLELADHMETYGLGECMAVSMQVALDEYARRIREACGVVA